MIRVLVCGSRSWSSQEDRNLVFASLDYLRQKLIQEGVKDLIIIEGECRGVDVAARDWAISRNIVYLPFPADWSKGKSAGPQRNLQMLKEGKPDLVIAFTNNIETSRGTKNMVTLARKARIDTIVLTRSELEKRD